MSVDRSYRFKSSWRRGQRKALLKAQGNRCALCPALDRPGARLHQAHLVAAPFGDDTQTILLCALCHRRFDARRASLAGQQPSASASATPRSTERSPQVLAPSHGLGKTSAVLQVSGGVGAGSPALPVGFTGVWGGCGAIPGE